ncbi:MAG: EamA family transporter [Verrucomicrobiota bacterium]
MAAVLLALAASASWGVSDFLGGLTSRRLSLPTVMAITTPLGLVAIGIVVAVHGEPPPPASFVAWGAVAGVLGAIGIASLYHGLSVGRMGVVAPISATAPLIPIAVGLARGDRPSGAQGVGIAFALVGMVLTSRERDTGSGRSRVAAGAIFGLIAAAAFGFSLVALDEAAASDPYWATLVLRAASSVAVLAVVLAVRLPVRAPRTFWPTLAVVAVLDVGGTVLFSVSTTKGLISIVAAVIAFVPVFVALLARAFLHEHLARIQIAGAAIAIAGVALISAGG